MRLQTLPSISGVTELACFMAWRASRLRMEKYHHLKHVDPEAQAPKSSRSDQFGIIWQLFAIDPVDQCLRVEKLESIWRRPNFL
jgi:hypothetical protein